MDMADVVTTWIDPLGYGYFYNGHVKRFSAKQDISSNDTKNWLPLQSEFRDNVTVIKFERYVKLCNDQGFDIQLGWSNIIVVFKQRP